MLRKAGFAEIAAAVLQNLRKNTGYACYDAVEKDTPSPFLFVEMVGKRDASSKTMFKEIFTVQIHAIATPSDARTEIYSMIQSVEESLTESIMLPTELHWCCKQKPVCSLCSRTKQTNIMP